MNLADKIRNMSSLIEEEKIAESLSLPIDLVKGIISGSIYDEALKAYDPAKNKETLVIEKKVFTRGKVLMTVDHGPLAGVMAICLAAKRTVAVLDLEKYPLIPLYMGVPIDGLEQKVNILWDNIVDKKQYKENLYIYQMPPGEINMTGLSEVLKAFETVIINCSIANWLDFASAADLIYTPLNQNMAGVHKLYQMLAENNLYVEKMQVIWVDSERLGNHSNCLSMIREFTSVSVAGMIPEMHLAIGPEKYLQTVKRILEPVFPELKEKPKRLFGLLS